jgi:hypothetical protein
MLTQPGNPDRNLVTADEVWDCAVPPQLAPYQQALRTVVDWAWQYLCRPHPELGRRGPVCPYTRLSLDAGSFYLAVRPGRPSGAAEVTELLESYRDWFTELEPREGAGSQLKTILVLFPDLPAEDRSSIIDETQRLLKSEYVARGLMIGEFHDGPPDKAGLWSTEFRPLRSPVPLLAIRHMVPTDLAFLEGDPAYLSAYLDRFASQVPSAMRGRLTNALARFDLAEGGIR